LILNELLYKVNLVAVIGNTAIDVEALYIDSRRVIKNSCFIAIEGVSTNGHQFIDIAIDKGANTIICSTLPSSISWCC
jgi:UDP-N-acetylmuramoyl-L-alanyl-D-glutamate--2,6-diaminopimelate ligase